MEIQLSVSHLVFPMNTVGLKLLGPKLVPSNVTLPPIVAGILKEAIAVRTGASKLKLERNVPTSCADVPSASVSLRLITRTSACAIGEPAGDAQFMRVDPVQLTVAQIVPPTIAEGVSCCEPKLNPCMVT
jgi:hypothetical protein